MPPTPPPPLSKSAPTTSPASWTPRNSSHPQASNAADQTPQSTNHLTPTTHPTAHDPVAHLASHLSDTRIGHTRDVHMDGLASAFGEKWVPNDTFGQTQGGEGRVESKAEARIREPMAGNETKKAEVGEGGKGEREKGEGEGDGSGIGTGK